MKPIKQSELFDAILDALGIAPPEAEAPEPAAATAASTTRPLRILLAEDSLVNQRLAVGLLERHGHRVTIANNGREALRPGRPSDSFDVVLMDVQMPELDGLEATRGDPRARAADRPPRADHRHDGPRPERGPRAVPGSRAWMNTSPSRSASGSCWRPCGPCWATRSPPLPADPADELITPADRT